MRARLEVDRRQIRGETDRVTRGFLRAGRGTIGGVTRDLELALEAATRSAVGGRLWRAWKSAVYPKSGISNDPTGWVFVNGADRSRGAMVFQTRPGRIRGKNGFWLAIPTPAAGSRGRGKMLTPGDWERRTGQRLQFIYRRNKPSLLVAEGVTNQRTGTYRRITRKRTAADERRGFRRGVQTVVIFILVPQVAFANKFAVEPIVRRFGAKIGPDLEARLRALP